MKIINISIYITDLEYPVEVSSKYYVGTARGVRIIEKEAEIYALVAASKGGLKIINITDPKNQELVGL